MEKEILEQLLHNQSIILTYINSMVYSKISPCSPIKDEIERTVELIKQSRDS